MDQRVREGRFSKLVLWIALLGALGLAPTVRADFVSTKFQPTHALAGEDEDFPESRFGAPPHFQSEKSNRKPASVDMRGTAGIRQSPELRMATQSQSAVQEISLIAGDFGYFPKTLFVTRDVPVRMYITGSSRKSLCLIMDSFDVRRQVRSQKIEEVNFTPSEAGQYRFYCPINGMEGTLFVRESVTIADTLASENVMNQKR